jgi:adenylyltransferase/sulfurtransferase
LFASLQAAEVLKILSGHRDAINRSLYVVQLWDNQIRTIDLGPLREQADCATCKHHDFPWLDGRLGSHTAVLCGRNAVQLTHLSSAGLTLAELAEKLQGVGTVRCNPYLLRLDVDDYRITVFADGRAIVGGTEDIATARTLYARFIGS